MLRFMYNYKIQHIVALAKKGDESALNQFCSVYSERLRRIIWLRLDRKFHLKLKQVSPVIYEIDIKKGDVVLLY
jgi:hypothetical protein